MKLHTSTRLSFQFSLVATALVVFFALTLNVFFLRTWMAKEQQMLYVSAQRPVAQRLFDRVGSRIRTLPSGDPRLEGLLRKQWYRNIIKNDGEWYLFRADPITTTIVDITIEMERQILLARLSAFGIVLFAIISFGVSRFFARKALHDLDELADFVEGLDVDNLQQSISFPHLPEDDEINQLADAISSMNNKIHEQVESIKQFIGHVSHEFKTPLMIMQSDSELALKTKQHKKGLEQNIASVRQLNALLESLLLLTKTAGTKLKKEDCDIVTIIHELLETMSHQHKKELTITKKLPKKLEIKADPAALRSILTNIIDNAFKYTEKGDSLVIAATEKQCMISDTGVGMTAKELEQARTPFWQADQSRGKNLGFGLGLSLVQKLIALHSRSIDVESKKGIGTTFTINW